MLLEEPEEEKHTTYMPYLEQTISEHSVFWTTVNKSSPQQRSTVEVPSWFGAALLPQSLDTCQNLSP